MATKKEEERRKEVEKEFLNLCKYGHKEGNIESVKALLAEDPSLVNSKDYNGKT